MKQEVDVRRNLALISTAALALALAGCGKKAENPESVNMALANAEAAMAEANAAAPMAPGIPAVPIATQAFVDAAASGDAFEIAESRLALTRSGNADVKAFASKMIAAHTESTARMEKAAATAMPAIIPDAALTPAQRTKVDALGTLSGAAFDKRYAADQVEAHRNALAAMRHYAADGTVPALKTLAGELAPVVQSHLDMAGKLEP